jgi:chaperonin GroES
MKLRPLSDCIVVKQHNEETVTASGIILAGMEGQKKFQGEIVACGPGEIKDNGTVRQIGVKVGEVVMFGEYSGQKFKMDGQEYLMLREKDVIGIVE